MNTKILSLKVFCHFCINFSLSLSLSLSLKKINKKNKQTWKMLKKYFSFFSAVFSKIFFALGRKKISSLFRFWIYIRFSLEYSGRIFRMFRFCFLLLNEKRNWEGRVRNVGVSMKLLISQDNLIFSLSLSLSRVAVHLHHKPVLY